MLDAVFVSAVSQIWARIRLEFGRFLGFSKNDFDNHLVPTWSSAEKHNKILLLWYNKQE